LYIYLSCRIFLIQISSSRLISGLTLAKDRCLTRAELSKRIRARNSVFIAQTVLRGPYYYLSQLKTITGM
jgi:hypothetical protein